MANWKVNDLVDSFDTKYEEGFTREEMQNLIKERFPNIDFGDFCESLGVTTGIMRNNELLTFHCDVKLAIRKMVKGCTTSIFEWD